MKQYILIFISVATLSVLNVHQVKAQDFHTSTMVGTGSQYSSSVTEVGAVSVSDLATTTYDQPNSRTNIRRIGGGGGMGQGDDPGQAAEGSPIGAPLIPLFIMAAAYALVKNKHNEE